MSSPPPVQPTQYAGWASGPSGSIRIVEPSATEKALGWQAGVSGASGFMGGVPPSTYFNWAMNLDYQWQKYFNEKAGESYVGDGSAGNVILSGATTYVLDGFRMFNDVAVGPSAIFDANGWPLVAKLLTGVSGTIRSVGQDGGAGLYGFGAHAAGGTGVGLRGVPASGPLAGGWGKGTGYIGPLGATEPIPVCINALGGQGGTGGFVSGGGAVILAATMVAASGLWAKLPGIVDGVASWHVLGTGVARFGEGVTSAYLRGGGGGGIGNFGAGGAPTLSNAAAGGGGGAGGGFLPIVAQEVNFRGTIDVRGGRGGTGGVFPEGSGPFAFQGGGGGGGGGGRAIVAYGRKTLWSVSYDARGGAGGLAVPTSGGATGYPGLAGATGSTLLEFRLP